MHVGTFTEWRGKRMLKDNKVVPPFGTLVLVRKRYWRAKELDLHMRRFGTLHRCREPWTLVLRGMRGLWSQPM